MAEQHDRNSGGRCLNPGRRKSWLELTSGEGRIDRGDAQAEVTVREKRRILRARVGGTRRAVLRPAWTGVADQQRQNDRGQAAVLLHRPDHTTLLAARVA